jgi:uncharacterized protein
LSIYYLDTSALAKLYHNERGSARMQTLASEPEAHLLISRLGVVEMESVFSMRVRLGAITAREADAVRIRFLTDISTGVFEVLSVTTRHFAAAGRLIASHGSRIAIRTLDALHLSTVLELPTGFVDFVVTSDRHLREVAIAEHLSVLNPEEP